MFLYPCTKRDGVTPMEVCPVAAFWSSKARKVLRAYIAKRHNIRQRLVLYIFQIFILAGPGVNDPRGDAGLHTRAFSDNSWLI